MGMSSVDDMNDVEIIEGVNSDGEEIFKDTHSSPQTEVPEVVKDEPLDINMSQATEATKEVFETTSHKEAEVSKESEPIEKPAEVMEEVKVPEAVTEKVIAEVEVAEVAGEVIEDVQVSEEVQIVSQIQVPEEVKVTENAEEAEEADENDETEAIEESFEEIKAIEEVEAP